LIVAQGTEAGGHVRGAEPLLEFLPKVLHAVGVPIVGAGGIATPEQVGDVLAAGADGVRVGTRFVAAEESVAHPDYLRRLIAARGPDDTVLTTHFDDGWPNTPHRILRSELEAARARGWQGVSLPSRETRGRVDFMALYSEKESGQCERFSRRQTS
jgi:NAD(P)H-dependent flavin oxidoreductase YrpB (nitropropane dioxygenase family)